MWYVIVIIVNRYILLHQDISHISSSTDLTNIDQRQHWVQTLRNHSLIKALHVDWIIVSSRLYMSTWKWIWRISLPNQSMVQHFELSEICFFTIVLMYATKGGSKCWSLVSKYISSWSIHSRGVTVNRWILHHQSSRDIPYHGGAFIINDTVTICVVELSCCYPSCLLIIFYETSLDTGIIWYMIVIIVNRYILLHQDI